MAGDTPRERDNSSLFVFNLLIGGLLTFLLLYSICGGIIVYMSAVTVGMVILAIVHWYLWGQAYSRTVAATLDAEENGLPSDDVIETDDDPYRGRY